MRPSANPTSLTSHVSRVGNEPAQVLLRVVPPNVSARLAGDVCVVVDVSGSMQQEATIKNRDPEAPILSVLDIVKHAVKTLVHTMEPGDRLGIVAYSDNATVVLPLTQMNEDGQATADIAADSLNADGQTNLWAGLEKGLNMLREGAKADTSSTVMVLTDGVPNVEPSGGHIGALDAYRTAQGGKLPCSVHTFGFGTDLDSDLLNDLACAGNGLYVFIPDASFVGTALVNCTANSLVTMGRNSRLVLEPSDGCEIVGSIGYPLPPGGGINLGSLQFGQAKDAIVQVRAPNGYNGPFVKAKLVFDGPQGVVEVNDASAGMAQASDREVEAESLRLRFVDLARRIKEIAGEDGARVDQVQPLIAEFLKEFTIDTPNVSALKEDVEGQVLEATSRRDWYVGWGRHYLKSLARAHLTQQCNNFKDPGVQVYAGQLFESVRDHADEMFLKLPPPSVANRASIDMLTAMGFPEAEAKKALDYAHDDVELASTYLMDGMPASRPRAPPAARAYAAAPAPAIDMRDYYDSSGP